MVSSLGPPPGAVTAGTVFRVTSGGKESVTHEFAGYPTDGSNPLGGLVQARDGTFYGTTQAGGFTTPGNCYSGCGTIFSLTPTGRNRVVDVHPDLHRHRRHRQHLRNCDRDALASRGTRRCGITTAPAATAHWMVPTFRQLLVAETLSTSPKSIECQPVF